MFYKLKIKTKKIIFYITILITSFILTYGAIAWSNRLYMRKEIGKVGTQTANALTGNLSFIFDHVTQFSNLIYFDENIQSSLKKIKSNFILPEVQMSIQKSLINMLLSGEYISSVFIFERYFDNYSSYKVGSIAVDKNKIQKTKWYREMKENEIVTLIKVFNHMILSIQNLIEKIKQEEKIIAKGKLDLIEA